MWDAIHAQESMPIAIKENQQMIKRKDIRDHKKIRPCELYKILSLLIN